MRKFTYQSIFLLCLCMTLYVWEPHLIYAENYTSLVYPDAAGKLVYIPDENGNIIPDFSYAGYMGGGVMLPYVPVKETVWPVEGDCAPLIQAAIDRVSALPPDPDGFCGAVLLKRGWYPLDAPLRIEAGGVVLRGEGQDATGTVLFGRGAITGKTTQELHFGANLVSIQGTGGREEKPPAARILDSYVPVGARRLRVENARRFRAGDKVIVRRHSNDEWFRLMGEDNREWQATTMTKTATYDFDRMVTAVTGDTVTVDAPITVAVEERFGGGEMVRYDDPGRIRQSGVENLRGESDFDRTVRRTDYGNFDRPDYQGEEYYADENHYWNFVHLDDVADCWVRDVTACHFAGSAVFIAQGSTRVTVRDCASNEPVSYCAGWRRYTFQICGQLCLVQRCVSEKGRHTFVVGGFQTCGPNVFLDCEERQGYGNSEPHMSLVSGSLYDNVFTAITLRYAQSKPSRWMSVNGILWNCEGMFLCQKPPVGQNYAFGQVGIHAMIFNKNLIDYGKEQGHIESWDRHVTPQSLYRAQLEERLGEGALTNIGYGR